MAAATLGGNVPGQAGTSGGPANESIVRGELVEKNGRPTLVAIRRLRWGTQVLSERPLLLVEANPDSYLRADDADARLPLLAEALGDPARLAVYIAFRQLHERRQKDFLAIWREDICRTDPVAHRIFECNRQGVDAFVDDHPEFSKLIQWNIFTLVASIFGRFGMTNPDGSRAVYALCSHVRHSCLPNAAWFTLKRGFPKGRKQMHIIFTEGIPRGEEITVSEESESILILSRSERVSAMFRGSGHRCDCRRCAEGERQDEPCISDIFARLQLLLATRPPTDESTQESLRSLKQLDKLLPFSMVLKAKAKVLLASALSELSQRAAWQEENEGANIIQWTGLDAEAQEQRLKDTKKLYETAAKDFEYLLGQDALAILKRLEAGYGPVHDQHKILLKYSREKERQAKQEEQRALAAQKASSEAAGGRGNGPSKEALPPGWDELFQHAPPAR